VRPLNFTAMRPARAFAATLGFALATTFGAECAVAENTSTSPSAAEILSQVQAALRTTAPPASSSGCHPTHAIPSDSKVVARFLSMTTSNIRDFRYFDADGVVEAFLLGDHPRIVIHLWVLTKGGACDQFELGQVVN
jgi:hypothetical protein